MRIHYYLAISDSILWTLIEFKYEWLGCFSGDEEKGYGLRPNTAAYTRGEFFTMGVMLATMIVQDGLAPKIFNRWTAHYLVGNTTIADMKDVANKEIAKQISQVSKPV